MHLLTAALLAAVIFFLVAALPRRAGPVLPIGDADLERRTLAGAFHIHTTRSDGTEDKTAIAAAAARAGLKFAVLTDHGDGTRAADPPAYLDGVLCLDAVEISTTSGHYIAVDMAPSAYPLGGEAAAVVEDVARLGGFGVAAHPDSPKPSLRWRDTEAHVDGLEWLNADSEWRDEGRARLARTLLAYAMRPAAALASLLDRPTVTLSRWDALTRDRAVVAVAGHDAHGGIGGGIEDGSRSWVPKVPSYEAALRAMSTRVIVDTALTGDAAADAALLIGAFRRGRTFTAIDAVAASAMLDFRVRSRTRELTMGATGAFVADDRIIARAAVPSGARTVLLHNGHEIAAGDGGRLEHPASAPGAYRVEVRVPGAPGNPPIPWILGNPIYLRAEPHAVDPTPAPPDVVLPLDAASWHVEHDPASRGTISAGESAVRIDYRLGAGQRASQFVALVAELPARPPAYDAIVFTGRASQPMRVSVQLRFRGHQDERWVRSVYLSPDAAPAQVRFADMFPAAGDQRARPDPRDALSLLFVVDLTNAAPGTSGWFSIGKPALAVQAPEVRGGRR